MNGSKKESNRRNSKGPGGAACINARRQNYPTCPPGFPDPATIVPKREKRRPQPPQPARHTKLRCPSYRTGHQRPQLTLGTSRRCCLLAAATLAGWPFGRLGGPRSRRRSSLAPTCGAGGAGCVPAGRQAGLVCTSYPSESASTSLAHCRTRPGRQSSCVEQLSNNHRAHRSSQDTREGGR